MFLTLYFTTSLSLPDWSYFYNVYSFENLAHLTTILPLGSLKIWGEINIRVIFIMLSFIQCSLHDVNDFNIYTILRRTHQGIRNTLYRIQKLYLHCGRQRPRCTTNVTGVSRQHCRYNEYNFDLNGSLLKSS